MSLGRSPSLRSLGLLAALVAAVPGPSAPAAQTKAVIPSVMAARGQHIGDPWRATGGGRGKPRGKARGPGATLKHNRGRSQMAKKRQRRHRRSWR